MLVSSIEYGPLHGGLLSGRVGVHIHGGLTTGFNVPAEKALSIIHDFMKPLAKPHIVYLTIDEKSPDAPIDDTGDFMEVLFQFQYYRVLHLVDPNYMPGWLPVQWDNRQLHTRVNVTLVPWLRWQATELIYAWSDAKDFTEPDLPNDPSATALYLFNETLADPLDFIQKAEHGWGIFPDPLGQELKISLWKPDG